MDQSSLFSQAGFSSDARTVRFFPSFQHWRRQARQLLQARVAPDDCLWVPDTAVDADAVSVLSKKGDVPRIPRDFLPLARAAACHTAEDRWALLYEVAWRLAYEQPHLLQMRSDPAVVRLHRYESAVRRDAHKMKAFVRFRCVVDPASGTERYIAWFEPDHNIVAFVADFFRRRFTNMAWSILTPRGCVHWAGVADAKLQLSSPCDKSYAPDSDDYEAFWQTYYKNIFNPARLKVSAMQSEMPQKYWRNLPEAGAIGELVRDAHRQTSHMVARRKVEDTLHCGPRPDTVVSVEAAPGNGGLDSLAAQAARCRNCALGDCATQTVFGSGPANARVMVVGEQPGDQEDLLGLPFQGPAGKLLDRALEDAGLAREDLYVTNAVKHFKFKPRGKRRLHEKPSADELRACLPWLQAELQLVNPRMVVALGRTALRGLLAGTVHGPAAAGLPFGSWLEVEKQGVTRWILATHHPAHVLRSAGQSGASRSAGYQALVDHLRSVTAAEMY